MAYSLVSHVGLTPPSTNGGTSGAIDTTGATLLIIAVSHNSGTVEPTISDFYSNTWTGLTSYAPPNVAFIRVFYAKNPTVGTGHTFTLTGNNTFSSAAIAAFSGADTTAPFDIETGNTVSFGSPQGTIQPNSLTPSQDNSLVITALGTAANGGPSGYTIDSSFTITDTVNAVDSQYNGVGLAYLIQTTATAENPTWSLATTGSGFGTAATIDSWKPASVAPSFVPYNPWPQQAPVLAQ